MSREPVGKRLLAAWRRARPKTPYAWVRVALAVLCAAGLALAIRQVFRPIFADTTTFGGHDWDVMETNRYLVTKTILRFHQFPFWNPYACGGHPAWGGFEADPIVVSPWLPVYLLAPFPLALRIEVVGMTVLGAAGAWLLASRFTRSPALCALVAALFVLNSRCTLQIATGHLWHTTYAWMPWVLYFYDRAAGVAPPFGRSRRRDTVLAAICLAMLVYMGGLYPLPHTAVALAVYAALLALGTRSLAPFARMAACGLLGVALAAPRLLPMAEVLRRFPRLIDSTETMDVGAFLTMLTSRQQDVFSAPTPVPQWGWHEWGMYVGTPAVAAIALGVVLSRGVRERSLRLVGLLALALSFGRFSDWAPWTLLHLMPVFASQHVPSRWMMPALLLLACVAGSAGERLLARAGRARILCEVAAVALAALVVRDVCDVVRVPLTHTFIRQPPRIADSVGPFRTEQHVPASIDYDPGEWAPSTLSVLVANIGSIDCGSFPGFSNYTRDHHGHSPGLGAHGIGDPQYRGEAYVAEGHGTATLVSFSPNAMTVRVDGAQPGDHVVLNQNWDPGWAADGRRALAWHDTVAATLSASSQTVRFRYRPRTLWLGLLVFGMTVLAPAGWWLARRRRGRAAPLC